MPETPVTPLSYLFSAFSGNPSVGTNQTAALQQNQQPLAQVQTQVPQATGMAPPPAPVPNLFQSLALMTPQAVTSGPPLAPAPAAAPTAPPAPAQVGPTPEVLAQAQLLQSALLAGLGGGKAGAGGFFPGLAGSLGVDPSGMANNSAFLWQGLPSLQQILGPLLGQDPSLAGLFQHSGLTGGAGGSLVPKQGLIQPALQALFQLLGGGG